MIYVASPYSGDRRRGYREACKFVAWCFRKGEHVISSIVHWHPLADKYDLPHRFEEWEMYDEELIDKCTEVYILCIPGWDQSVGVKAEIEYAHRSRKPVTLFTPNGKGSYTSIRLPTSSYTNIRTPGGHDEG